MKKIVLILDSLTKMFPANGKIHGGANRIGRYLIEYFSAIPDIKLDIICGTSGNESMKRINKIYSLGFCPFSDMNKFFEKAQEIIHQNNYDIILTSDLFPPFGNIIVHSHTLMYKNQNCKNILESFIQRFLRRKKTEQFKRLFANKERKIFAVSKKLAKDYIENLKFNPENVICVYPGTDQKEKPKYIRQTPITFGIVAGNAINKGGYLFLGAVFLLKLAQKNFKAKMIVTKSKKGSTIESFLNFLRLQDKIEILPEQEGMTEFYKKIDCLVLPSLNEAFGLVLTEAASMGKPTLVSSTAGSSEIITNNENGFIFERSKCFFRTLYNLFKKMEQIINTPQENFEKISNNAYILSQKYTWDNFFEKIAKELKLNT